MGSFLLYEIRNVLRLEGYEVDKYTNRRVINTLLELKKDSTLFDICDELKISYIKWEREFVNNDSKKIFLHLLETKNRIGFNSINEANKSIGINILSNTGRLESILEKKIFINGEKAVLSLSENIDTDQDFPWCMNNKININLALSSKLGYTVDHEITLPEIFSILGEKIPSHGVKCQLLEIPYFFEKREGLNQKRRKVLAKAQDETLMFNSLSVAGKFFQIDAISIKRMIEKKYRLPFWFKRYTLEFVLTFFSYSND